MDHNSYPMKKLGYDSRDYEQAKSNSCASYVRYFLLSTSIIQLLIIMGLVLFMIYGNNQSSQQNHLESTQNQSVEFIGEINKLRAITFSQNMELRSYRYRTGNLTIKLMTISKRLNICISQKNVLNTTIILSGLPHDTSDANVKRQINLLKSCKNLHANYSIVQRKLESIKGEQELQQAKHTLEVMKLNSQLADLRGNCSSMGREFQNMMTDIKANYEARYRPMAEQIRGNYNLGLNEKLEKIKANCLPLPSSFQSQLQEKIDRFDAIVRGVWQNSNQQNAKISALEKRAEECRQEAAAQFNQFKVKEAAMQEEKKAYLAEKVLILEERNKMRRELESRNPGAINTLSSCHTVHEELTKLQSEYWRLKGEKVSMAERRELERQLESLTQLMGDRIGK
ncbi:plasmalemma vesicle-associated protein-like [Scyliorhinus canicula]|uniref:plasmalemma vesicle-associated protein-like n=1 Tax=Scyliorhinus canicula TaxID=7830 RepID=UPI0018F28AF6|nr:plasmalemma vesicle-associated protein-like [Scyliorhinus canicula]